MKKINKSVAILFAFSLLSTICFPLGIFSLIYGASNDIVALLVIGITLTVVCFFAIMILWVFFGLQMANKNLIKHITSQDIHLLSALAQNLGQNQNQLKSNVQNLINKGYLLNYAIINDIIINKTAPNYDQLLAKHTGNLHTVKCPGCGAFSQLVFGTGECSYCGTPLSINLAENN